MALEANHRRWLAVIVALVVVGALSSLSRRASVRRDGWRTLEPGALQWAGLVLGGGLFLVCLYVRLFVGSSRADAKHQRMC
jgi:hypothetical protein